MLKSNLNCDKTQEYINCKNKLDEVYDDIPEGIKVRSECQRYEKGEKSIKFFLNLEKTKGTQDTVKKLEINNKKIDNPVEINNELERIFENLFERKLRKTKHAYNEFLKDISLPILSQEKNKVYDNEINDKSPGNDGLTKEFYEIFWEELRQPFMNSLN